MSDRFEIDVDRIKGVVRDLANGSSELDRLEQQMGRIEATATAAGPAAQ
ncbi:MAG: hypothetical protein JOZ81_32715 [Chloroflexi bacterium]|nr:hypothetical protein [Chloroflexota bacterium]MBV9545981.1 hypothetical protein [Chloroflexota bacterium]